MSDPDNTGEKQPATLFKPGKSGNPKGRPKGARNRLGEDFLAALASNFEEHGAAVIETVRTERPHEYLKVVASLLPKQVEIREGAFDSLGDDELAALVAAARSALAVADGGRAGSEDAEGPEPPSGLSALH